MRRPRDFYETPARALLAHVPEIGGAVLECCVGDDGSIARVLRLEGRLRALSNDVVREREAAPRGRSRHGQLAMPRRP